MRPLDILEGRGAVLVMGPRSAALELDERNFERSPLREDHRPLEEVERRAIEENLKACDGHREKTARRLGITSRTLRDKLKRWRVTG